PRFLIGEQRHRRDLAGAVALGAAVVKDRRNIFGEGGLRGFQLIRRENGNGAEAEDTYGDGLHMPSLAVKVLYESILPELGMCAVRKCKGNPRIPGSYSNRVLTA